jgi:hypothetical protein
MRDIVRITLTRVIPIGFVVGACMETFMYYTGFWDTVRKNALKKLEEE